MSENHLLNNNRRFSEANQKKKLIEFIKKSATNKRQISLNKKKKSQVGFSSGQWTFRQVKLYFRYLSTHKNQFTDPQLRKKNKVFIKLADYIGSRTPDQCRSHHQKATKKNPQFQSLLQYYQFKISEMQKIYDYAKDQNSQVQQICFKQELHQKQQELDQQNQQPASKLCLNEFQNYLKQEESLGQPIRLQETQKKVNLNQTKTTEEYEFFSIEGKGDNVGYEIVIKSEWVQQYNMVQYANK